MELHQPAHAGRSPKDGWITRTSSCRGRPPASPAVSCPRPGSPAPASAAPASPAPLPVDGLARVGRHAAHDGRQRALGHVLQLVERLAGSGCSRSGRCAPARRGRVVPLRPWRGPCWPLIRVAAGLAGALGADEGLGDAAVAAVDLPAHAQHVDAVGVLVVDGEVVEDVAVVLRVGALRCRPPMPTARTGWACEAQLITSRLWTCCSTM